MEIDSHKTSTWSRPMRIFASVAIIGYLLLLLIGPLTNPVGAPHTTLPVAQVAAPLHQALFMGHGYRFFAPDPGPSHSVHFTVTKADGETTSGHFPDRENTSPRLMYHRWFMLSESLFQAGSIVPTDIQIENVKVEYAKRMEAYFQTGKLKLRRQLAEEQRAELEGLEAARERRDTLIRSIAGVLLDRHQGESIQLSIQERLLPTAEEVVDRVKLADKSLIRTFEIGQFTREQIEGDARLRVVNPVATQEAPNLEIIAPIDSSSDDSSPVDSSGIQFPGGGGQ